MTFTPVDMSNGSSVQTAHNPAEYWGYVWQGYYVLNGSAPIFTSGDIPRSLISSKGDLIVGTASGIPSRQPIGADGLFLKADSSSPTGVSWATASAGGILASQFDAKGDLLVGTANDALSRFAAGTNGQVLTAQSGQATGLQWATLNSSSVGLGNVNNTSDANKPVSTAQQTALNGKVDTTTTVAGAALSANVSAATIKTALALVKGDVGLGNVTNNDQAIRITPAMLTAAGTANSTTTPAVLSGHTFVIPPGMTLVLNGQMIFRSAATTTGAQIGIRVTQPSGASAAAVGSFSAEVAIAAGANSTALRDGGSFNVAANSNTFKGCLGTGVSATATDHVAVYQAVINNPAATHSTTVTVEFASEVASSAITPQAGTGAVGILV